MRPVERIERLMLDRGVKPREVRRTLSEVCGISVQAVGQWFTTDTEITAKNLQKIADSLGTSVEHLLTGRAPSLVREQGSGYAGVKVPVVDLASAAVVLTDKTASPATMARDWKHCPVTHGPRTFAYLVTDDAMTAVGGPKSYPAGCYVFVDPDVTTPQHDKPVIARLPGGEILLANYMSQAGRVWLRQLNPAYPPVTGEFEVAGVVIGKWEEP